MRPERCGECGLAGAATAAPAARPVCPKAINPRGFGGRSPNVPTTNDLTIHLTNGGESPPWRQDGRLGALGEAFWRRGGWCRPAGAWCCRGVGESHRWRVAKDRAGDVSGGARETKLWRRRSRRRRGETKPWGGRRKVNWVGWAWLVSLRAPPPTVQPGSSSCAPLALPLGRPADIRMIGCAPW